MSHPLGVCLRKLQACQDCRIGGKDVAPHAGLGMSQQGLRQPTLPLGYEGRLICGIACSEREMWGKGQEGDEGFRV